MFVFYVPLRAEFILSYIPLVTLAAAVGSTGAPGHGICVGLINSSPILYILKSNAASSSSQRAICISGSLKDINSVRDVFNLQKACSHPGDHENSRFFRCILNRGAARQVNPRTNRL